MIGFSYVFSMFGCALSFPAGSAGVQAELLSRPMKVAAADASWHHKRANIACVVNHFIASDASGRLDFNAFCLTGLESARGLSLLNCQDLGRTSQPARKAL